MTVAPEELRSVLRQWASGVTIVTAARSDVLHGMTVSAFSSVSLEPPLIAVNIERRTRTHALMSDSGAFGVNILAIDQQELARRFGGGVPDIEDRLGSAAYRIGQLGSPLLEGCLANLECRIEAAHPAGTHTVFIGEAVDWKIEIAKLPLLYWQRQFRAIEDSVE